MNLMIVHPAIQDQLIPSRPVQCEACLPLLVATLREVKSSARKIDGGAIGNERIVQALQSQTEGRLCVTCLCVRPSAVPAGEIEDGTPPTGGVGEQRQAWLFVDRHLLHLPDAIERRERSASPRPIPVTPALVGEKDYEPQTKYDLRGKCDPVGPDATEEFHLRGRRRGPVQQQESDQPWNVGGQEKAGEQDEVEGMQLCRHIVCHVRA